MDSGSSKTGGIDSASRPLGPSGEHWRELLLVVLCVVSGDIIGDACCELDATEEALIAEEGIDADEAGIVGRELVLTWLGFARRPVASCDDGAAIFVEC